MPDPAANGRAGCVERRVPDRELAIDGWERARDEVLVVREPHCAELRASGVLAIEQIVDLADHLQPPGEAIARSEFTTA